MSQRIEWVDLSSTDVGVVNGGTEIGEDTVSEGFALQLAYDEIVVIDGTLIEFMSLASTISDALDVACLAKVSALVRAAYPKATSYELETTDQSYDQGFWLKVVSFADGESIEYDEDDLEELADEASDYLGAIHWNGVAGEDRHGRAVVAL